MIQNCNNQSIKGSHPTVKTQRNQIVRTLQVLLTTITMLFALGVQGAWADVAVLSSPTGSVATHSDDKNVVTVTDGNGSTGIQQGSGTFTIDGQNYTPMKLSGSRQFNITYSNKVDINSVTLYYRENNTTGTATLGTSSSDRTSIGTMPDKNSNPAFANISSITGLNASAQFMAVIVVDYTPKQGVEESHDATLKSITVYGSEIAGFASATKSYNVQLAYGTTVVPTVGAASTDANATVNVTQASALPGAATINVTAEDGTTTDTYTLNLSVSSVAPTIPDGYDKFWYANDWDKMTASTTPLSINGITINNVAVDATTYNGVEILGNVTQRFNFGGAGAIDGRRIEIPVDGPCEIHVWGANNNVGRCVVLHDGTNSLAELCTTTDDNKGQLLKESYTYKGETKTLYLYSKTGGFYVIAIGIKSTEAPSAPAVPVDLSAELAAQNTPQGWTAVSLPNITINTTVTLDNLTQGEDNAAKIQAAIDAASAAGGGKVVIPAGEWLSGQLLIKSNVVLHLSKNCTLKMLPYGTYPAAKENYFIGTGSETVNDVIIEGEDYTSIIDGQGAGWWTTFDENNDTRPAGLVRFRKGTRYLVRNIQFQNSPKPNLVLGDGGNASHFTVHDVKIVNPSSDSNEATADGFAGASHNTDGIPVWGPYCNIYKCNISTGDDNVVFDSNSQYCHVWDCDFGRGHGASIGSNTMNVHDILWDNIRFNGTQSGFKIKTDRGKGNELYNITYQNSTMTGVRDILYMDSFYGSSTKPTPGTTAANTIPEGKESPVPAWHDITYKNITATNCVYKQSDKNGFPIYFYGLPESHIKNVTIDNVTIEGQKGMFMAYVGENDANGVTFQNGCNITNVKDPSANAFVQNYSAVHNDAYITEVAPEWESLDITLNAAGLLTTEDMTKVDGAYPNVDFGISVDNTGKVIRVEKGADNAIGSISGKYHSDHGMYPFTMKLNVPGAVKITAGTCSYGTVQVKVNGEAVGDAVVGDSEAKTDCWKNDHSKVATGIYTGEAGEITITVGSYCPYIKIEKYSTPSPEPTIAFEDFKIDFRVTSDEKRYTVTLPDNGELPECVTIVGDLPSTNGNQHGLNQRAKIKVHVNGPTKFTIGGCYHGTQDGISVTVGDNAPIAVNNKVASCESSVTDITKATYTNYEVWSYTGTEPVDILFEFKNAYLPYFFGKAIVNDWTPTWDESKQRWEIKKGATDAENGESLLEALDHLKRQTNKTLYLPNGTYDLGTNTCNVVPGGVTIKGESMEGVIIKNAPEKEGIGITATLQINDNNVTLEDLTLYCRAPYGTIPGDAAERGVCLTDRGNNNVFRHITLDGYQDTYYSWKAKEGNSSYFYDCIIKGNVDFICGSGNVWFENCRLQVVPSHSDAQGTISSTKPYITAPSTTTNETGYVFNNCTIENATSRDMNGNYYLGRGWQAEPKAAFYNTVMKILPVGEAFLYSMGSDKPALPCVWREMGSVNTNGTTVNTESRPANVVLDKTSAEAKPLPAVKATVENQQLKWNVVDGAAAYNIYKGGVFYVKVNSSGVAGAKGMRLTSASDQLSFPLPYGEEEAQWTVRAINSLGVLGLAEDDVTPDTPDYSDEAIVIDTTNRPFGFVTATDRTNPASINPSNITGGGAVTIKEAMTMLKNNEAHVVRLTSDGVTDMKATIYNAIKDNNVIIFDGSDHTDFIVSEVMNFKSSENSSIHDKTIIGINGARICTQFFITERYKNLLDNVATPSGTGVTSASTAAGTGGTFKMKNGTVVTVNEGEEYYTRMTLYNALEDARIKKGLEPLNAEPYRYAGLFYLDGCYNIIFRNLKLVGPGSVDVGGTDLMSIITGSHHIWVDHCEFTDGIDGNFDITDGSDFVTVSWCKFGYTDRAYAHENTNLVGSDDNKVAMDSTKLNVTFAYNEWGKGCDGRMPMARFGKIHMLNNYYTCYGNTQNAMNPRKNSEFLIEGNLWAKGVTKTYKEDGALNVTWGAGNVIKDPAGTQGTNKGNVVTVPYQYAGLLLDVNKLTDVLSQYGGAVLSDEITFQQDLTFDNQTHTTDPTEAKEGLTFSVWADGAHTYQWYMKQNGDEEWTKIAGASRNSYTYTSSKVEKLQLKCRAYGVSGMKDSKELTLVIMDGAPQFLKNLNDSYTLYGDQNLTLEVDASNLCTYQWYKCDDTDKTNAQAIDGATARTYKLNKATEGGTSYYYCVATYTPTVGDATVLTSNVATVTSDLNNGRKLWVYGYYDQSASEGKGDSFIKNAVGTSNTIASTCDNSTKCTVEVNRTNYVSGYVFTPCGNHYNAPVAYGEFTANSALVSTDKIKIGINSSASDTPAEQYGFYLCTENTKTDASLIKTIAIPNSAGKNLYEETINVADYYEKLVGKTNLYLLPFTKDASNRKVTIHEVLVLTYPAGDPEITTDIETEYDTPKGQPIELTVKASNVKGYQWYTCTAEDKTGATAIDGATSALYTFPATTSGNYYIFCRATGLKADTYADSHVAAIEVTRGAKKQEVVYDFQTNVGTGVSSDDTKVKKTTATINGEEVDVISLTSSLTSSNTVYWKITPESGTFKTGDVITWTGCFSNSDNTKVTTIWIFDDPAISKEIVKGESFANVNGGTKADPKSLTTGTFTLTKDAEALYVGRTGGTGTYLTQLTVTRTVIVEPEAPAFTTNLDDEYNDEIVGIKKTLTVAATGAESYQWYKNSSKTTEGATAISGATAASYDFTATEAGDTYLYCVATNDVGSTTSTIAKVSAAAAPVFTTNLESEYTTERGTAKELTVEAVNATGYQWYVNTKNSTEGAQLIPDATSKTYSCPAANLTTRYYYCVAKGVERNATSDIAKVTVVSIGGGEIFKFVYDGTTDPAVDSQVPVTTGGTTTVVRKDSSTKTLSKEGAKYNAGVENDFKGNSNGIKFGTGDIALKLDLTIGTFKAGDKISITGYNPFTISSTGISSPGDVVEEITTGSSASDYNVGTGVIPDGMNPQSLYILRKNSGSVALAVISVTRAAEGTDVLTVDNYVGDTKTDAAGTVDVNDKAYVAGDEVLMTATAGHGYKFDHWATADGTAIAGATEPTYLATIAEGGITYRAVFTELPAKTLTLKRYLLGEEVTEGTDVKVEVVGDANLTHPEGEQVKVKASVATGYSFLKWTSDVEGNTELATTPEYTYTIGADNEQTIYAHFDSQYIVEFVKGDDAAVVGVAPKKIYLNKSGDKCPLPKNTSLYKAGYTLTGWKLKNSSPEVVKAPGGEYEVTSKGGNVFEPVFTQNTVNWAKRPSTVVVTWSATDLNDANITWQNNTGVFVSQVVYDGKTVDIPIFIDATTGKFGPSSNDWIQVNDGTKITFKSDATNLPALKKATIDLTSKNAPQTATLNGVAQTSTAMSCKLKAEADVVFVADAKVGYLGDIKLTLPAIDPDGKAEIGIYSTDFTDWDQVKESNTVTTKDKGQKVTFTLTNTTASTGAISDQTKLPYTGYLMSAKSAADVTTTAFNSVSKVVYTHGGTSKLRGWGLKVKGDGDADWVTLKSAGPPSTYAEEVTIDVNRTNVQLQFFNVDPANNAYLADLVVYSKVELSQCEPPTYVKGDWDPATEKWNYTVTAGLPDDAVVHYCEVNDGAEGAEQTGTDEVAIKIAPGEKYKFWTVDSYDDLPISNKVEITGDAMKKTTTPTVVVAPYSVAEHNHTVTISGLDDAATAHYTIKNSEGGVVSGPTDYTGEFTITPGQTVEVYASQTHYANSDVVSKATTTITLPQKETFKSPGPGKSDNEVMVVVDSKNVGVDNILNSATIEGKYISGINGETGLKYTINNTVGKIGDKDVKGIEIKVHEGFVINHVDVEGAYSNDSNDKTTSVKAVYVDGVKLDGFTQKDLPKYSSKQTIDFAIEGIEAKKSIVFEMDDNISQARANISVTYDFIDEPATVAIKKSADGETIATIEAKDFTDNAYTYGTTLDYIPVVEMTTKQGYVYTMQDKDVDGFNHTFKYTLTGKEYSVKTNVSVLSSPGINVDESKFSIKGGYPVTLAGAGTMYINIDNKEDAEHNLIWEEYDPEKTYYAVKYVKSYCVYNETSTKENPGEYTISKDKYDYKKPFAAFVRQPSYLDSQDGSNPYNSVAPEADDKIYQALQTNFNVVDYVVPSSTDVAKVMPEIADAKLVVITEMISGSGSFAMQRPQDKEVQDSKSTALTMTLLRDVVDKTNVLNFKMFTYSQSKNNTDRWGWAQPAALPSNIISINPVEPNGGGMFELFSEAKMNLDGTITLWDNINEDKSVNHLQPVFNFNEAETTPSFIPLAMAVDPDNDEEQYHILHYYDKTTNGKKTTYVGFGLSVNEWTAYNDNVKAIIEKIGAMIIADRPLNTKLDHIVNPKITDNGDGSAMVMNNNFSAKTYYLAKQSGDSAPGAEVIERDGTQTTVDNNFNTIKYTTDMVIYAVSKLGDAYSGVVSDTLKGSTTRYITRINDDPEATGLVARYPFEVNTDGTAKTFNFPYNQSWKKDGYTVTKWIAEDGTEYIPGTPCTTLTQDITVKAVWEENKHQITDLSKDEDKVHRTVKWEFLQSKGAPALAMEHKAGEMQAVIVGQVKFKDGTWLDVPMTINTDNNATLPDNGISYHGKFNNVSINWMPEYTDGTKVYKGSDYAQVRTGTQFTFPSVYGMNVVYKQVDLIERDLTTHKANGNINRSQVSQSYLTDGTINERDSTNYWRFVNPGYQLTPGWKGEVLQLNSKIVFDGDAALLAHKSPITEKYKNQGANLVLYDEDTPGHTIGGNANYGGLINYTGEGKMATLTSVESAQYIHVGSSKKLGALNYGSVFMQSLEVTYPALYDLTCKWIAVDVEQDPKAEENGKDKHKSSLDQNENPGKIEKLNDSHANCNGRFNLNYPVLLKLTPAYGYYVDVDNDEVKDGEGKVTTPAYYFLKDGKLPKSPLSLGTNEYIHRYCDLTPEQKAANDTLPATHPDRIPVEGANIKMIVKDIDLVVSMKKYDTYSYDITPYRQDYGVIEYNTGTGRKTEDEYNTFPVGKIIVISATPKIGYKFTEWRYNPTTDDPTQSGTVLSNVSSLPGVTLGDGTSPNPNAAGDLLEKNQLKVVVGENNSGSEHKYYAIFDKGVPGTAHYQFNYALEEYVDKNGVQTRHLELTPEDINAFPDTFPSTALNIPRYYTLFKEGYTLDHWIDNSKDPANPPTAGSKVYRIGTFYYFENENEHRYLVPVFRKNVISYDHRAQPVDITWDFRTSKFAQEMQFVPDDKDKMIYYSTHATINNEHLMDVPLKITLGSKGKLKNNTDDEWCSIGEGSEIVIPSGIGAKFTVVSLSKMTSTQFIEKDAFGNVVNSTIPTSYTTKEENGVTVYYYTFTTESTSTDITLKIGNDYSYYKYIRAELPAADAVPLETTVNNPSFGTVEITKAVHSDGSDRLSAIKKTMVADEQGGAAYTLGLGTTVTLTSKRTHQHVVDYFEDIYGTKYYWDATKVGNIRAISADGKDVSEAARNNYGISMAKATDFMNAENDFALTFIVTAYRNLMHVHYKENTLYQINYTSGDEAEGEAPGVKVIEAGESFKVPNENHYLYIDGQTLKYWEDEKGNKYDFGQSYTPGQLFTNTTSATLPSGLAVGDSFTVPLDNLFLTPHFDVNDFTIMNLTEEATAVWPLTREGKKSGSDDSKADFAGNDGVVIYFQKSVGIYVTPLKLNDGRFIDLKVDIDCAKAGKVDNQSLGDRCQINGESTISLPSSSNCAIKLYTINGKLSTTKIAGATATEECKDNNDKVITTKYTSTIVSGTNEVAAVDYTGESTKVDIEFMGEAGYFYQIEAIYKPVQTTLPKLDNVTINNIALGALGTYLSDKKLSTLKKEGHLDGVAADLSTSKSGNMPVVKAAADNGGYVEITQATIDKPVATLLVKTAEGVTVSVHKISFTVTPPENAPIITDVKIGTKYQCDIEVIDADAIDINKYWYDIYPEGSYIYGYKDKRDSLNYTIDKYLKNVENVGINGSIAIRFNKPMKAVSMVMKRLKGQTISAEEGQTLVFSYWNLDLDTQYKDTIPAGTFEDIYGNKYNHPVVLQFKTVENALTVESRLINFVVTHNQPAKWNQETLGMVADGEPEKIATDELINNLDAAGIPHGTLNEGIAMANAAKDSKDRFYIFVPDGEYQLMGNTSINASYASNTYPPADNTGMLRAELVYKDNGGKSIKNGMTEIARDNISITGQSEDKTIVWNRPEIEGISYTATFRLNNATSNFYAQDMTWENRFDFKTSIAKQGAASAQAARAVVLQDRSAKSIFKNIKLLSYQDTYYSNPTGKAEDTRYYFENCTLAGYVDFLCGSGDVWLEKCNLMVRGGKGTNASNIMAPAQYDTDLWGYVFNHCDISAEEEYYNINNGKFTLARPWQNQPAASLLYTTYHVLPTNDGYKAMSKTGQLLRIHEYRSYLPDSTLVDLSQRSLRNSSPGAGSYDAVMTPSEAARYTVFNAMGGTDGYDPTIYTRQVNMDKNPLRQDDTSLSWEADDEALCYFIFRQETETGEWKLFAVTDKTDFELDDNQLDRWFYVRAANQRGGLGLPTEAYQYKAHESYKRELAKNNQVVNGYRWSTIYLDFNAKAPIVQHEEMVDGKSTLVDDIYVYALVEIGATELKFQRVKTMAKNCGYLIKAVPRAEDYVFKYTEKTPLYYYQNTDGLTLEEYREKKGIEPSKLPKLSLMNGSVVDRSSTGLSGYTLSNKAYGLGFYKYTGSKYNANYAWIDAAYVAEAQKNMADVSAPDASAARAGFMKIVFDDDFIDDNTTGINGIREYEISDDAIYNLSGQRINPSQMQRGMIYIIGGKKVKY